jgi:hypothetical protein
MDLVFDKSGLSLNGVPTLIFARDNMDFTNDLIVTLNKPGRLDNKPAGSPAKATATPKSGQP